MPTTPEPPLDQEGARPMSYLGGDYASKQYGQATDIVTSAPAPAPEPRPEQQDQK